MDIISPVLQSIGYLLLLVVLALLWRKTFHPSEARQFWILLAGAWTLNLLGNTAWIVHDFVTGTRLNMFSFVDLFYVLRYVLVGCALWLYPVPLSRQAWLWIGGAMLAASTVIWAVYFTPAMPLTGGNWTNFLGLAVYPTLDAGIIALAWLQVRAARQSVWSRYAILLFCVAVSYGIANTVNLIEYIYPPASAGIVPNVFWILTDIFLLVMTLGADVQAENKRWLRSEG